jgi:hypothetical protein
MRYSTFILIGLLALAGCDQIAERAGFQDPAKVEAEGKAIGAGCRHAGQGLEDCYRLNPVSPKAAIYAGWKEMNEYMVQNNMQSQPPEIPPRGLAKWHGKGPFDLDLADQAERPKDGGGASGASKKATKDAKKAVKTSKND